MAVETYTTDIEALLGDEAEDAARAPLGDHPEGVAAPARARLRRPRARALRPQRAGAAQPAGDVQPRPPRRHGLRLDPARRPGHRALRRRVASPRTRTTSTRRTSSSSRSRAAATPWPPPSACSASVARKYAHKIPFIVKINHNELLTYPNKFDQILFGNVQAGLGHGRRRPSAPRSTSARDESRAPDRRGRRGLRARPTSSAWPPSSGATCATSAFKKDGKDYHARRRPHRPGQPPRRDDPGRHHQAEAAREQRRLQGAQLRQDRTTSVYNELTTRPPDRPHAATRWPTATWAAPA